MIPRTPVYILVIALMSYWWQPEFFHVNFNKLAGTCSESNLPSFHAYLCALLPVVAKPDKEDNNELLFTAEELKKFKGEKIGTPIYLALLGRVFDVSKGPDFYGPGGGYAFFAGCDASKAFVSGDFVNDLTDDVTGLSSQDYWGLGNWLTFYTTEYRFIGKLIGRYFDENGVATPYSEQVLDWIAKAEAEKAQEEDLNVVFPPCNSEWDPDIGARVWCSNASGGIQRDWIGFPRKLFTAEGKVRCACVESEKLSDSRLQPYLDCDKDSTSCMLEKSDE
uniref:EOG090X0A5G n=1 Tax=Lynceus sp. MCZ IZ 141354 TaxID=1930659 RepID=A0A9N6WVZ2_9CRUS|nr:EOG090X0A5G [Lynceus sp. MCZ IZ 141354]